MPLSDTDDKWINISDTKIEIYAISVIINVLTMIKNQLAGQFMKNTGKNRMNSCSAMTV